MKRPSRFLQSGMTLLELSVVLLVLMALAGLVVPYVGNTGSTALCQTTDATMQTVKQAIMGGSTGAGFYGDTLGHYPSPRLIPTDYALNYLFDQGGWPTYNPKTGVGWRGPYLMSGSIISLTAGNLITPLYAHAQSTGQSGVNDSWGRPLVLQVPDRRSCDVLTNRNTKPGECARLVSAGPGSGLGNGQGDIDTLINIDDDPSTTGTIENQRGEDDRILYLRIPTPVNDAVNIPCDES